VHLHCTSGAGREENQFEQSDSIEPERKDRETGERNDVLYHEKQKPENRMELRLAVNAGSILETEEQRGLAHFCEHMAFNGTKISRRMSL